MIKWKLRFLRERILYAALLLFSGCVHVRPVSAEENCLRYYQRVERMTEWQAFEICRAEQETDPDNFSHYRRKQP